jgi:hypothetical protein
MPERGKDLLVFMSFSARLAWPGVFVYPVLHTPRYTDYGTVFTNLLVGIHPRSISLNIKTIIMEENKNINSNDEHRSDDDQLRGNTMNEAIREASGNPDADLNEIGASSRHDVSSRAGDMEDLYGSDPTRGISNNPNDMSGVRSGGTTDIDDQTASGAGLAAGERPGSGSNLTTRRTVTGSDFDGQDKTS